MKNFIFLCCLFLTGCSTSNPRYVSAPGVPNTVFFRQAGDLKLRGAYVFDPGNLDKYDYSQGGNGYQANQTRAGGWDVQAAYALTNHFYVAADAYGRKERDIFSDDDLGVFNDLQIRYERSMVNAGVGFYAPLGFSRKSYFNFMAGLGIGKMSSNESALALHAQRRYHDADLFKINLHPAFNFFYTRYFRMSVAPRFSFLKFNNISTNFTAQQLQTVEYDALPGHFLPLFEPSIELQASFPGANWLKFDAGFHFSSNPDIGAYNLNSRKTMISLGLSVYPFER